MDKKIKEVGGNAIARDVVLAAIDELKYFTPKKNQQHVLDHFYNSRFFLMNQPPGSGKSMTIGFCMAKKLQENPTHKVLIIVPQTLIAKSFGKTMLKYSDNSIIEWDILHNFCIDTRIY